MNYLVYILIISLPALIFMIREMQLEGQRKEARERLRRSEENKLQANKQTAQGSRIAQEQPEQKPSAGQKVKQPAEAPGEQSVSSNAEADSMTTAAPAASAKSTPSVGAVASPANDPETGKSITSEKRNGKKKQMSSYPEKNDFDIKYGKTAELLKYHGHEAVVRVPDGVKCIGREAFTKTVVRTVIEDVFEGPAALPPMLRAPEEVYIDAPTRREVTREFAQGLDFLKKVILPEGVEEIDERAFYGCENLTHIELPRSLRIIRSNAFKDCRNLKKVVLPSETEVFFAAFEENTKLVRAQVRVTGDFDIRGDVLHRYLGSDEYVHVPDGVRCIGEKAFRKVTYDGAEKTEGDLDFIREVTLPLSVEEIGDGAFMNCRALKRIAVPTRVTEIGRFAFSGCENLEHVELPGNLRLIRYEAFGFCRSLKRIVLPPNVLEIHMCAFQYCENLEYVEMPEKLRSIGSAAFAGCRNLRKFSALEHVREIDRSAFEGCENLEEADLGEEIVKLGEKAFFGCRSLKQIKLPETVKKIEKQTFEGCASLEHVEFPPGLGIIGICAFRHCTNLKKVHVPAGTTLYHYAFGDETEIIRVPHGGPAI